MFGGREIEVSVPLDLYSSCEIYAYMYPVSTLIVEMGLERPYRFILLPHDHFGTVQNTALLAWRRTPKSSVLGHMRRSLIRIRWGWMGLHWHNPCHRLCLGLASGTKFYARLLVLVFSVVGLAYQQSFKQTRNMSLNMKWVAIY